MKIAVVGLGKLGSSLAAVFASKGHEVFGCDLDPVVADKVSKGFAPVEETGLQDLLGTCGPIPAATDIRFAAAETEIVFIIVPTPSIEDGSFSTKYVRDALFALAATKVAQYQVIAIVSTVSPGSMALLRDQYEAATGGMCGKDFGMVYNPEFIALGSVIHDLLNPSFVLVGESDERAGNVIEEFYKTIHDAPLKRMSIPSAEIAKLGLNVALTQRISYANTMSELCERTPGASASDVLGAIGADKRIGHRYLGSGTAYGGPCFPRDGRAFVAAAKAVGAQAHLAEIGDVINQRQTARLLDIISLEVQEEDHIGILGLTYKTDTDLTTESAGLALLAALTPCDHGVSTHDPRAPCSSSLLEIVQKCHILVLTTPWPEFQGHLPGLLKLVDDRRVLIDCWNLFADVDLPHNVKYIALGEASDA